MSKKRKVLFFSLVIIFGLFLIFDTGQVQGFFSLGQQPQQDPASGPQVAHPPVGPDRGKFPQPERVLPQGKYGSFHNPASSRSWSKCRVMRPVSPQMARPSQG